MTHSQRRLDRSSRRCLQRPEYHSASRAGAGASPACDRACGWRAGQPGM